MLIIAGPGSGKTFVLVLRTLNILLQGLAKPGEILLCTFTEKSAFELRDRISSYAKKLGYNENLHELHVGTIHGISNDFVMRNRHRTPLGHNYDMLDDLTQLLFIFDNFKDIIGDKTEEKYYGKWDTKWTTIYGVRNYFNKITEERIDVNALKSSTDPFVSAIAQSYEKYLNLLIEKNKVDFAIIQKYFFAILQDEKAGKKIISGIKYVLVDEYQDTNYIQEQLMFKIASNNKNICVVGDEDQSLYRFRGATVRNILEFNQHFSECKTVNLVVNYRSHEDIINRYNRFMESWNWESARTNKKYRFEKSIEANPNGSFPEYPAVFSIWGTSKKDEATRVADLVKYLKDHNVIEDYSQVALLLHSVRRDYSGSYIDVLESLGVNSFCPRQRGFFDNEEIKYMVACFAVMLNYYGENRGEITGGSLLELTSYIDEQITDLGRQYSHPHSLGLELQSAIAEIESLNKGKTLDKRLADFFYQFLAVNPFKDYVKNENKARNLAIFSQLLNVFQNYYHYTVITSRNLKYLRMHFFNSFLRLLYIGGINEYEDPDMPFPKNHVQIMTIHQSKGLEFPVVIVDSLSKSLSSPKEVDRVLGPHYHRPLFEPEEMITGFDRMRLHYVAFSRAEKILVLSSHERPNEYFNPIWQGLPQWPYVKKDLLKALFFRMKSRFIPKRSFSFSSDLKTYETCPRQYLFFREYDFTPSRSAEVFFGSLVHDTIEEIHRYVMDSKLSQLDEDKIRSIFEFDFRQLLNSGIRPIGKQQKELAFQHVMNYFNQNQVEMKKIIETEVDVSLEKEDYILLGKIDLLLGEDDILEILDFKSMQKPENDVELIQSYHKQLCIYAHIIEERYDKTPKRLVIYWTGQEKKENARMVFTYKKELVSGSVDEFDQVVKKILNKDFVITKVPEKDYCNECDLRGNCRNEGLIPK